MSGLVPLNPPVFLFIYPASATSAVPAKLPITAVYPRSVNPSPPYCGCYSSPCTSTENVGNIPLPHPRRTASDNHHCAECRMDRKGTVLWSVDVMNVKGHTRAVFKDGLNGGDKKIQEW